MSESDPKDLSLSVLAEQFDKALVRLVEVGSESARLKAQPGAVKGEMTYGQRLIAEAITDHFGEPLEDYDEDADDTSLHDVWEAFYGLLAAPVSQEPVAWQVRQFMSELDPPRWGTWQTHAERPNWGNGNDVEYRPLYPSPQPTEGEPVAEQIADAVLSWMVKFDLLDADNEYGPEDVLAVLNDLAPAERPITEGEPSDAEVRKVSEGHTPLDASLGHRFLGAIDNLLHHQIQLDMDGINVGVSRQALCEVLDGLNAILAAKSKGGKNV